ncbi:unnamed protein product, partial [Laminaria digitata]
DGSPCGLLNHLATTCRVVCGGVKPPPPPESPSSLESILVSLGVAPAGTGAGDGATNLPHSFLPVVVDGRVVGGGSEATLRRVAAELRRLKVGEGGGVDPTLEVAWVPPMKGGAGPYPGLFLNSDGAR